jgi:hypothetical protein
MRTIDFRQQNLPLSQEANSHGPFIWFLISLSIFAFIAYLFFIYATIWSGVHTRNTNELVRDRKTVLISFEQEYLNLSRGFSLATVQKEGLAEVNKSNIHFILPDDKNQALLR